MGNIGQKLWETGWETGLSYLEYPLPTGGGGGDNAGPPPDDAGTDDGGVPTGDSGTVPVNASPPPSAAAVHPFLDPGTPR